MEYEISNLVYDAAFSCGIKNKTGVLSLKVGFACLLILLFALMGWSWGWKGLGLELEFRRVGVGIRVGKRVGKGWSWSCGWDQGRVEFGFELAV